MTLGKQARLEAGCSSVPSTEGVINKGKGTCGPTGMSKITWISCDGHKRVVEYNELGQPIGESVTKLKSFIGTTVRVHIPISYQSWKDVPTKLKDKICELIEEDLEKLKNPPIEYSFIDHEHWNLFVASRLTEQFEMVSNKGRERRKNNKYNHRMSRKGYANLAEEMDNLLVSKHATHSTNNITCDILSQVIGGNDPPGRIQGVGQYITPSKYVHTAREKRKKVSKEEDYAEERARMAARETDESKIKSQMASKSIDTSDDANDHDAEEENRQVLEEEVEIEDLTIEKQDKDGTSYRLAIGTKDNVVGAGTIFDYDMDGNNVKVSVDMVVDGNCFVPIPTREGKTILS
ncbi:uncharacterized protein E5676_scaffold98G002150 [Cucumis melo var. makuwa]|uniref:Serine/threonine-protein kinase nek2 n=1 Tax=Cucumis melo var. makuwa TaxID=1194695 RepID=A0A5D3C309_CUCMM|nr:uncharacterized protein E5676_scaffold98G002150 [Cucumis melo var. makuwa]